MGIFQLAQVFHMALSLLEEDRRVPGSPEPKVQLGGGHHFDLREMQIETCQRHRESCVPSSPRSSPCLGAEFYALKTDNLEGPSALLQS